MGTTRVLYSLAAAVVVVAGMKAAASIVVPFFLAVFITVIVTPAFISLQQRGVPAPAALAIFIVVLLLAGSILVGVAGEAVSDYSSKLPVYSERIERRTEGLVTWLRERGVLEWLETRGILDRAEPPGENGGGAAPEAEEEAAVSSADETGDQSRPGGKGGGDKVDEKGIGEFFGENLNPEWVMQRLGDFARDLGVVLSRFFVILLVVVFMLFEAAILPAKMRKLPGMSEERWRSLEDGVGTVRHYMALKSLVALLTGFLVFVLLTVMGSDSALLLGCLAFFVDFVPNIGAFIAGVPAVLLVLVERGVWHAVGTAIGYAVINALVGNLLEPRFMGKGLGLSPLIILISLIFWGWVLGPVGMLLSIPLTVAVKLALDSGEETRWMAMLMGSKSEQAEREPTSPGPSL